MATTELERFRLKVREYRLLVNRNQSDLATYLNLDYNELSNRLNAHKNARLSHDNVRAVVRALAEWGAITTQAQAEELLDMMLCPHFDAVNLQARPLSKLAPSASPAPAPAPSVSLPTAPPLPNPQPYLKPNHNLPQPLSSFIGRRKEVAELKKLLVEEKTRLLTLVGAGGTGKTRLSLKVAGKLQNHFTEGVWLVELAPLANAALIPQTIASVLGVTEQPGQAIVDTIERYLRQRQMLLVLDNCEHLIEECARVVERLLNNATQLQIMATSREELGLAGEVSYGVPSLSLPGEQALAPEAEKVKVADYEALELFVERAKSASPDFGLEPGEVPTLVQICRRLDGIPLALELAAARAKVLTLAQIAARLDDRFRLLTSGGSRTALPRQQTLRALVDWSYALLTEGEQRLLARVSVFAGSWDLAAAEAVCSGDGLAEYEVLDGLTNLINKSLVMLDKTGAEVRYYLLETIRQYGLEKLKAGGEEAAVRQRHFAYYIKLGSELETKILGTDQLKGLKLLTKELDNLRTALDYSLETAQFEAIIAVMTFLYIYWDCRGYYSELRRYVEQALALPSATGAARGIGLFHAGFLASMQGDSEASRSHYKESLALSREYSNNKELAMVALGGMGMMQLHLGNYAEARDYWQGSLALVEEDSRFYKAAMQQNLGLVLKELGEYEQAHRLFEASLAIGRELGNPWLLGYHLRALGELALILEEYDQAHSYLAEALELGEKIGFNLGKPQILTMLGIVYAFEGKFKEARQALEESLTIDWQRGYTVYTTRTMVAVVGLLNRVWLQEKQPDLVTQIACLCGMISAWYTSRQVRSQLPDRTYYEQGLAVARSGLDEATFEAAFARSQAMSAEEATIYARQALAGI